MNIKDVKDVVLKISTPIQLVAFVTVIMILQLASLPSLSFSPLAITTAILLVFLTAFVVYVSRQKSLIDNQIIVHEAVIIFIKALKKDKKDDQLLIRELDIRLQEQRNSLKFARKQKQKT